MLSKKDNKQKTHIDINNNNTTNSNKNENLTKLQCLMPCYSDNWMKQYDNWIKFTIRQRARDIYNQLDQHLMTVVDDLESLAQCSVKLIV